MIKILSDSTCDLSPELVERYNVGIIPLHVYLGEEEYLDGKNIFPEKIYEWSNAMGLTPRTSAPVIEDVIEEFRKYLDQGDELVVFTISSSMSASFNVCKLAAETLDATDRVAVIDSENLTTGIGHLVIEAAEMAAEGKGLREIEAKMLERRKKLKSSFVVDTLVFLHRGGRCSGLAAMLGSVLKLHPRIVVENGAMHSDKKYRGTIDKVIMNYIKDLEENLKKAKPDRVFITHSSCSDEFIAKIIAELESLNHFKEIFVTRTGCVVSSHCGPGTLGILFIEN
ncbi:MAG: DegV family protein [Lachnospiraceae bacterium]|nr:DegV family protein [Lachnospiraceae bacterium]